MDAAQFYKHQFFHDHVHFDYVLWLFGVTLLSHRLAMSLGCFLASKVDFRLLYMSGCLLTQCFVFMNFSILPRHLYATILTYGAMRGLGLGLVESCLPICYNNAQKFWPIFSIVGAAFYHMVQAYVLYAGPYWQELKHLDRLSEVPKVFAAEAATSLVLQILGLLFVSLASPNMGMISNATHELETFSGEEQSSNAAVLRLSVSSDNDIKPSQQSTQSIKRSRSKVIQSSFKPFTKYSERICSVSLPILLIWWSFSAAVLFPTILTHSGLQLVTILPHGHPMWAMAIYFTGSSLMLCGHMLIQVYPGKLSGKVAMCTYLLMWFAGLFAIPSLGDSLLLNILSYMWCSIHCGLISKTYAITLEKACGSESWKYLEQGLWCIALVPGLLITGSIAIASESIESLIETEFYICGAACLIALLFLYWLPDDKTESTTTTLTEQ